MKKLYETPEMEVFNFETTDEIMDSCTGDCPTNTNCDVECPTDGESGCMIYDPNCPSECFLDGLCLTDINISLT